MEADDHVTIETFPAQSVPHIDKTEIKIFNLADIRNTTGNSRRRLPTKPQFTSTSPKRGGFLNSRVSLSKSPLISTSDLLTVRSISGLPSIKSVISNCKKRKTKQEKVPKLKSNPNNLRLSEEIAKFSYPCYSGCANCAFTTCLGPVRVYVSRFKEPKEYFVREICDGQGRQVIPRARRREFRGLVYDEETHSLYPPLPKGYTNSQLGMNKKLFY